MEEDRGFTGQLQVGEVVGSTTRNLGWSCGRQVGEEVAGPGGSGRWWPAAGAPSPYLHPRRSFISGADAWTYSGTELQSLLAEEEWQDRIFTACAAMDSQMEHGGADAASTGESTGKGALNSEAVVLPTISATR